MARDSNGEYTVFNELQTTLEDVSEEFSLRGLRDDVWCLASDIEFCKEAIEMSESAGIPIFDEDRELVTRAEQRYDELLLQIDRLESLPRDPG